MGCHQSLKLEIDGIRDAHSIVQPGRLMAAELRCLAWAGEQSLFGLIWIFIIKWSGQAVVGA